MLDDIVLATTTSEADDPLAALARDHDVAVFRGSEEDVLHRVVEAHRMMESDIIVEICGDCPLLEPVMVDLAVETFLENDCDVVASGVKQSYPQGTEVQVFPRAALEEVEQRVGDPAVREHVSLHFFENQDKYRIIHLIAPKPLQAPELRLQLDYPEDLTLIREIFSHLEPVHGANFGVPEIIALLQAHPELREINRHCEEKPVR